eukprot:TRINITY_DN1096_c0_g1_i2.p1 TRINITY_DN1096_c0_g1~~TRINITY_DN1096_c0_g1_i2.p1  ORF type:complete len:153 (+),score=38.16 TRINITY_DN1096_c0_g1_i2:13-471(+)
MRILLTVAVLMSVLAVGVANFARLRSLLQSSGGDEIGFESTERFVDSEFQRDNVGPSAGVHYAGPVTEFGFEEDESLEVPADMSQVSAASFIYAGPVTEFGFEEHDSLEVPSDMSQVSASSFTYAGPVSDFDFEGEVNMAFVDVGPEQEADA